MMSAANTEKPLPSPEETASAYSKLCFKWIEVLMKKAYQETLTEEDIWDVNVIDKSSSVCPVFERSWSDALTVDTSSGETDSEKPEPESVNPNLRHRKSSSPAGSQALPSSSSKSNNSDSRAQLSSSLIVVILKTFWRNMALSLAFRFVHSLCFWFSKPFLIGVLLEAIADPDKGLGYSVSLTVVLMLLLMFGKLMEQDSAYLRQRNQMQVETALQAAVFRKALNLHNSSRKNYSVGHLTNLMSGDVRAISGRISNLLFLSYTPLNLLVIFLQLYLLLGAAALLGLVVMVLLAPFNMHVSYRITQLFKQNAKNNDEKLKLLNEVLTGIKVLKLHAWEKCFGDKLRNVRRKEEKILKEMTYYRALHIFSWNTAPYLISIAVFAGYFYWNQDSVLGVRVAFSVITALNLVRLAINQAPDIFIDINKLRISARRVENFLLEREFEDKQHPSTTDASVKLSKASFTWDTKRSPVLKHIDISFGRCELIAFVGQIGAGKSSLISAVLGEIQMVKGHRDVQGSIAYVSQQAWIQNDTLQNNILFGKDLDTHLYRKVVQACALQPDLDLLPAGDQTEIGERGINLSGGQKQRVSLARAVYNDADIYLLDDPLSAVDSHVGKHIFDHVIKQMLGNKICVLVTHNLRYLPEVDGIIVLDQGVVAETGSFRELLKSEGAFNDILKTYLSEFEENRECFEDLESEDNKFLDSELKSKLKRLDSEDKSQGQTHRKRLTSVENTMTRQTSVQETNKKNVTSGKFIEEEKYDSKDKKFGVLYRYIEAYGVWNMTLLLVFYTLYYGTFIRANLLLAAWTDDSTLRNASLDTALNKEVIWRTNMYYLSYYTLLGLIMSVFILLYAYMMSRGVVRASQSLHDRMLDSILSSPMEFFDTTPVGRITNRFSHDIKAIDDEMPSLIEFILDCIYNIVIGLAAVVYTSPEVLAVVIPLFFYYVRLHKYYNPAKKQLNFLRVKMSSRVESFFVESVTGSEVIRAYGHQPRFRAKLELAMDTLNRMKTHGNVVYRWLGVHMMGLGNIIFGATTMLKSLSKGTATAAMLGFGSSFALDLSDSMRWLVVLQSDLETHLSSVERIEQYIASPNESEWRSSEANIPSSWPERGQIEFQNYSLRYRQGYDLVLRHISFTVNGGEKVGIIGRTGAGKSSLVSSLFRLVEPAEGSICIDGVDIANIGLHDLREKLAIIPQDPVLFTGPLRMNLDPMDQYTDQEIWTALEHCNLQDFVQSQPDRLQTECGEGGNNFSVGQRQLFCLARTLLRKSKILVLDEATAAVDMETDDLIQQTIRSEFKDSTVLTIAHRLNTIMDYNRLLVLENGHVVEFGTPSELLQNDDGVFSKMAQAAGIVRFV